MTYGDYVSLMGMTGKLEYEAGEYLFREGDQADGFLLLLSGEVEVRRREGAGGRERTLATLNACQKLVICFGVAAVMYVSVGMVARGVST